MSRALLANRLVGFASLIARVPFLATYSGGIAEPEDIVSRSSLSVWMVRLKGSFETARLACKARNRFWEKC